MLSRFRGRIDREPMLLLLPAMVLLIVGFVLPVFQMLLASVTEADGASGATLENYRRILDSSYYLGAAWRSLKLGVMQVAVSLALAVPLAYLMTRVGNRLRALLLLLVVLPLMTSVVVRTFGWVVLLGPSGAADLIPGLSGLMGSQGLLGTESAIVIAMVQVLLPFAVLTTLSSMRGIEPSVVEASRTMGASWWTTMRTVVLPLSAPGIIAGGSLIFALSISSFITPQLVGGSELPVLAGTIYTQATIRLDWPFAAAQAVLLLGAVMLLLAAAGRVGRRWE